jgi:alpha-1,2-mannosyltransferase
VTTAPERSSASRQFPFGLPRPLQTPALIVLIVLVLAILSYTIVRGASYSNDFKNPYRVARVFWQTGRLDIKSEPRYPPTVRVLLAPLAALPIATAATLWAVASLAAIAALPRLFTQLSGIPARAQALAWLAVLTFVIDAVVLGQSDPINLLLVTSGLVLARQGRAVLGAGLIGLAGMIKVLPLAFWSVVAARRRVRDVLIGAGLTALVSVGLLTGFAGGRAGIESLVEWSAGLGAGEGPWGLIRERNSLRANNESLPVVLARTFGALDPELSPHTISVARLPLRVIWGVWLVILAAMAVTWIACAGGARRAPPDRAWLGMYALTAVLMLALTHIAWPHYFVWLLPAALFLSHRARVLLTVAALGQLGMMIDTLRGLGCHMWLALALFVLVAHDLLTRGGDAEEGRRDGDVDGGGPGAHRLLPRVSTPRGPHPSP